MNQKSCACFDPLGLRYPQKKAYSLFKTLACFVEPKGSSTPPNTRPRTKNPDETRLSSDHIRYGQNLTGKCQEIVSFCGSRGV
ncbi:MAG: hypothetical protein ACI9BO_000508 [Zhongshania sp.]|jgi:hypothetical protein